MEITKDIRYIGVNDHDIDLFEGQYVVPNGMAYNSYAIIDEKIAIMDSVEAGFKEEWFAKIEAALDGRKPDEAHIGHLIELLGIEDRLSHLPGAMSGGQQQRVCIARALSNKPAILFADEPTGNLDGKTGREVLSLMRTVGKELGITLIMVTHDITVAEQAERVIRLEDGQVAEDSGAVSI